MASLWRKSQEVLRDDNDLRAVGARASFFAAGTTTPLTVYKDNALTTPHAHPVRADAVGRMPAVFFPLDAAFKERVETASGSLIWEVDHVDPAPAIVTSGGGGGTVVDPFDLLDTGFIMPMFETGIKPGWVRANGRSIGNPSSPATERANPDCEALFTYLWNASNGLPDALLPVGGGRGSTAAADWAANRTMTLPDLRGRVLVGLNGMGNAAGGALNGFAMPSGSTADTLFAAGGAHDQTLTRAQMPEHDHGGATAVSTNAALYNRYLNLRSVQEGAGENGIWQNGAPDYVIDYPHQHNINKDGSNQPHPNCQPFRLVTFYIKLKRGTA